MKVLIYMEPWIEKSDPTYRINSFFNDQMRVAEAFEYGDPTCEIKALVGDAIELCGGDRFQRAKDRFQIGVVSQLELKGIFSNYKAAAHASYQESLTVEQVSQLRALFDSKIGGFTPDVIFAFESAASHLRAAYPSAVLVTHYFAPLSREPFPRLHVFDVCGIFRHAVTSVASEELRSIPDNSTSTRFMDDFRARYFDGILAAHDPIAPFVEKHRSKFDFIVLLPLQGSNYFAFEENSHSLNLFDYICDVLDKIDPRIGVIVTEHTARERIVDQKNIEYLRRRYQNFIYIEELNEINFHSQFLLKHVDAVITVSSSLGFLASMAGLTVFNSGTFETFVNNPAPIEDIHSVLYRGETRRFDSTFEWMFSHVYVPDSLTKDPDFLFRYLAGLLSAKRSGQSPLACYQQVHSVRSLEIDILVGDREKKMVEQLSKTTNLLTGDQAPADEAEFQQLSSFIDLKKAIKDAKQKAVSFDLFDTLIIRPFHRPRALFAYIESDVRAVLNMEKFSFARQRGKVEKKLRQTKKLKSGTWDEVGLDEIYEAMAGQFGWTSAEREKIKQMEVDAEVSLIRPRQPMAEVLAFARSCNKKILVITDTYLPEAVIRLMMEKCGILGDETLFVSSSHGVRKQDGRLFDVAMAKIGLRAKDILHIGDNPEPDGIQAARRGVKSLILRSPIDRFVADGGRVDRVWSEREDSLSSSIALGVLANTYDNYPHSKAVKKATLFNADPRLLGAHAFGPLVLEFARWVHKRAIREGHERLYFLSREGLLFKRAYDLVCKHEGGGPVATYLRASRRSSLVAASFSLEDSIRLIFKKMTRTPLRHILTYKLGLDNADQFAAPAAAAGFNGIDQIVDLSAERQKLLRFFTEIQNPILSQAAAERAAMEAYLASEGLTGETAPRSALVDVGYAGTIQRELGRILHCTPHGLYLGTTEGIRILDETGARSEGFLFNAVDPTDRTAGRYHEYVELFEGLFCAPEASFKRARLGDAGKIELEFNDDHVKRDHAERIGAIHDGAIDFVEELLRSFPAGLKFSIEKDQLLRVATQFFASPQYDDARLVSPVVFDNKMGDFEDKRFLPAAKADVDRALASGNLSSLKDRHIWEEGVNVMVRKVLEEARPGSSAIIDIKSFATLI